MSINQSVLLLLLLFSSCFNKDKKHEPITRALEYYKVEVPNFENYFNDTIFVYVGNINFIDNESEGNFFVLGEYYVFQNDTIFFNKLPHVKLEKTKIINEFKYLAKDNIIKIISEEDELRKVLGKIRIENQTKYYNKSKWLFTINAFRKNNQFAVFQFYFQANTRSILGCEFIYDYSKNDFIEKQCDLPFKG